MWQCVELEGSVHSVPLDDWFHHIPDYDCDCNPRVEVIDEFLVNYQHKSFDGREHIEPDHDKSTCAYCVVNS